MQTNMATDLKAFREGFTNIRTQLASAATEFEGRWTVLFDEVTGKLGGLLNGLAPMTPLLNPGLALNSLFQRRGFLNVA